MKYLENEKLTEISSELSEAMLGDSHRIIQGRIEAYTMKRGGRDKKFAKALGQKYVAEIEELQEELIATIERRKLKEKQQQQQQRQEQQKQTIKTTTKTRKRSNSDPSMSTTSKRIKADSHTTTIKTTKANTISDSKKSEPATTKPPPQKRRAQSFDFTLDTITPKTTIGDFSELSTQRLMTDLILTLNASFPDYDFSNVKPNQFHKLRLDTVRKNIYEKLSELASQKSTNWLVELWSAIDDVIELKDCDVYSFDYNEIFDDEDDDGEHNSLWSFHYFFVNKTLRRIVYFTCCEKIDDEEMMMMRSATAYEVESDHDVIGVAKEQVRYYNATEAPLVDDFEWDPSDTVAGGMSLEVSMG